MTHPLVPVCGAECVEGPSRRPVRLSLPDMTDKALNDPYGDATS